MSAAHDWESVLKNVQFDLPPQRWEALEAGLRQRIRDDRASLAVAESAPTLRERLQDALERLGDWFAPAPARWAAAGGLAILVLGTALWLRPGDPARTAAAGFQWQPGQTLQATGVREWDWPSGRSRISLRDGAVRLEGDSAGHVRIQVARGEATFHVQHRAAGETFQVGFGSCRIEVVGTTFTISADSLGSSARVVEGRVRFVGEGRDAFLDAGQELSCSRPTGPAAPPAATAAPATVPVRPSAPEVARAPAPPSEADLAYLKLSRTCQNPSEACTEARADFVHRFGSDSRAPEIAWAWGQTSRAAGDVRDALFAWDVASRSRSPLGLRATLAACELRLGALPDADRAARDLDAVLGGLEPGSTLWVRAWSLRRDAARSLGQAAVAVRAESLLSVPRTVSGGP